MHYICWKANSAVGFGFDSNHSVDVVRKLLKLARLLRSDHFNWFDIDDYRYYATGIIEPYISGVCRWRLR
jgi:hypothetical protein